MFKDIFYATCVFKQRSFNTLDAKKFRNDAPVSKLSSRKLWQKIKNLAVSCIQILQIISLDLDLDRHADKDMSLFPSTGNLLIYEEDVQYNEKIEVNDLASRVYIIEMFSNSSRSCQQLIISS